MTTVRREAAAAPANSRPSLGLLSRSLPHKNPLPTHQGCMPPTVAIGTEPTKMYITLSSNSQSHPQPRLKGSSLHLRVAGLRKSLHDTWKRWAPLLPAKESWDDEYNFQPGPFAGQGRESRLPRRLPAPYRS
ncbi:uncharacterized protein BO80DRAFT_108197 [Aspergillus ibericus CBS 121593]|uniref:Uncharacterized protein n=1 Tax=Aspergillus ibericus CBS 121593 TaxID=1448316 RepID=A0A395H1P1_9EURO|nr:hypothetical protein BO80DRAFT_108197 [Aspergillus ibericus CBS 121593]RAL00124.1 hypothetical protein BO80DRAFT_108197 [Aspergillus ibericus CBS 121593]